MQHAGNEKVTRDNFCLHNYYTAPLDWAANSPCTPVLVQISLNTFRDTKSRTKESKLHHPVSHTLHTPRGQREAAGCQSDQNTPSLRGKEEHGLQLKYSAHKYTSIVPHWETVTATSVHCRSPEPPYQLCSLSMTAMRAIPSSAKDFLL